MILLTAHSLTPRGRFEVETCPLTLEERNSQIQFTLPVGEAELTTGDWIRDDTDPGAGIVYRIRTVETNYQTRTVSCTAEHIIKVLRDTVIFGEVTPSDMGGTETSVSALAAIKNAINRQSDWVLNEQGFGYGSVSAGYTFNGDSVYEAIETVCSTLEDCWWSYDVSVYPFVLTIAHKATTATCEMRGGRNISSIRRTVDRSRMYTRIYPIGKENLHITGNYLSKNTNIYGVICKVETDQSIESEDHLRMWAQGRLNRHCEPSVTTSINGLELSQETGEPLDHLTLGTVCRVPLPEFGTTLNETITKLQWRDKIKEPENVSVTLSNEMEDVASIIRQEQASGSGLTGRGGRAGAKKAGEDHAWFVDTDDHVSMVAEAIVGHTEEAVNWSRVAELTVDGQGIHGHVTQAEQDIIANRGAIEINERNVALTVKSRQIPNDRLHGYTSRAAFPATGTSGHYYYYETGSGTSVKRYYFRWNGSEYIPANVITGLDGHLYGNYVNAGEIAVEINESGNTEAHIDAKKIILGKSQLTSGDLDTWAYGAETGSGVFAQYMTVDTLTAQSVITKKLDASFAITGQLSVDGQASFAQGVIVGDTDGLGYVEVDGPVYATDFIVNGDNDYAGTLNVVDAAVDSGVLKIWKVGDPAANPSITFSKATSLTPAWSGGATAGETATLTLTGSPDTSLTYEVVIGSGTYSATKTTLEVTSGGVATIDTSVAKSVSVPVKINELKGSGTQPTTVYTKDITYSVARLMESKTGNNKVTANGSVALSSGKLGFSAVTVDVPMRVSYDSSYTPEGASEPIKVVKGNENSQFEYLRIWQRVNELTGSGASAHRTVETFAGSSQVDISDITDYGTGYGTGYTAGNAHRGSRINGFAQSQKTTSNLLQADKVYELTSQYTDASGNWQDGGTYLIKTPPGGSVTWPSAISRISSTPSETQSASFTANGTTKSYTIDIGDFTNAQGQTVNAARLTNNGSVVAALDINGLLTNMFIAGENNIKNAGGEYTVSSNGDFTLNQYVTILHVGVSGSHSPSISSGDIWTTDRTLSGWTRADTLKSKYEQAKRDSEYVAFRVKCGGEEHVYYMEP